MATTKKPVSYESALSKATATCSATECSAAEIQRKLTKLGVERSDIEKIIDWLVNNNFIDEYRFARAFVNDKYKLGFWGRRKIVSSLKFDHHISQPAIESAISDIDTDVYLENLNALLTSKFRSINKSSKDINKKKASLFRAGLTRGYEASLITGIVSHLTGSDSYVDVDIDNFENEPQ